MRVISDFPGGNAEVVELDVPGQRVRLRPRVETDGSWEAWWWCRIEHVNPNRPVVLELTGGTPRGERSWAWGRTAVRDATGEWRLAEPGTPIQDVRGPILRYTVAIQGDAAELAYAIPYTRCDVARWKTEMRQARGVEAFTLCHSRGGHPIDGIRLRSERQHSPVAVVVARQHAFESGASWVCDRLSRWLLSNAPAASTLRSGIEWIFIPLVDVDSVAAGRSGKLQPPHDHNRDWTSTPHWPETRALQTLLRDLLQAQRLCAVVDLHGPGRTAPYFFMTPPSALPEPLRSTQLTCLKYWHLSPWTARMNPDSEQAASWHYDHPRAPAGNGVSLREWMEKQAADARCPLVALTGEVAMGTQYADLPGYQRQALALGAGLHRWLRDGTNTLIEPG